MTVPQPHSVFSLVWLLLAMGFSASGQVASTQPEVDVATVWDGVQPPPSIASYQMEVELDPGTKTVQGHQILTWTNTSEHPLDQFCFHLYLNAFRNNRSTVVLEGNYRPLWEDADPVPDDYWGYTEVESIVTLAEGSDAVRQILDPEPHQPDDDNLEDRTVFQVSVTEPLPPGESVRFRIDFTSKLPRGTRRTGWRGNYFFVAQWFPKIGVFQNNAWNCHQYHRSSEYFADFGVYDVSLTVPTGFVVGATGQEVSQRENGDETTTHRYFQEHVHDFVWTASPHLLRRNRRFVHPGLPEVEVTLLLQPENRHLEERYFTATLHALRYYGEWFGAYPYTTLTVVDPAYRSRTGGMEYPTLVTGGAHFLSPVRVLSPEAVTIHEVGHQWWYGMVASNEFEESWLDEGLTSWSESRVAKMAYPPSRSMTRILGGIPVVFPSLEIPFETSSLPGLRSGGKLDILTRRAWEYQGRTSYVVNSYRKPELVLWTLERLLGEATMMRAMRTYFQRYRFRHPTTADFISVMSEVAEQDLSWFFEQTFFSSDLVDYGVETATSKKIPEPEGVFEETAESGQAASDETIYLTEVVVQRYQEARFPVDVLLVFEDGEEVRHHWDGQYRWQRYRLKRSSKLEYAQVDPDRKLLLDIDPTNNSRYREKGDGFAPATKVWATKWLFWLQNLLEAFAFIG